MQVQLHHPDVSPPGDIAPLVAVRPPDAADGFIMMLQRVARDSITPAPIRPPDGGAEGNMPAHEEAHDDDGLSLPGAEGEPADRPGPDMMVLPGDAASPRQDLPAHARPGDAVPLADGPQSVAGSEEEEVQPASGVAGVAGLAAEDPALAGGVLREGALPFSPPPSPPLSPDVANASGRIRSQPDAPPPDGGAGPRHVEGRLPARSQADQADTAPVQTNDRTTPVQPTISAVSATGADNKAAHGLRVAGHGPAVQHSAVRMVPATSADVRGADHSATGDTKQPRLSAPPAGTSPGAHVVPPGAGQAGAVQSVARPGPAPSVAPTGRGEPTPALPPVPSAGLPPVPPDLAPPNPARPPAGQGATTPAPLPVVPDVADMAGPDVRSGMDDGSRGMATPRGELPVEDSIPPGAATGQDGQPVATAAALLSPSVTTMPAVPPPALPESGELPPLRGDAAPDAGSVSRQVALAVRSHAPGVTEIRLDPPELGALRLDLRTNGTVASLVIGAERPEALDLVRSGLHGLAGELRALGYERVEITLDHSPRDIASRIDSGGDGRADADTHHTPDDAARAKPAPDQALPDPVTALSAAPRRPAGAMLDIRL